MDVPFAAFLGGDAERAAVERGEHSLDGIAHGALGGGIDGVARLPGGIDGGFELGVTHGLLGARNAEGPETCGSPPEGSTTIGRSAAITATQGRHASATARS